MGWVKKIEIMHCCNTPDGYDTVNAATGSIWECDDCGKHWRLLAGGVWYHDATMPWSPDPDWIKKEA